MSLDSFERFEVFLIPLKALQTFQANLNSYITYKFEPSTIINFFEHYTVKKINFQMLV